MTHNDLFPISPAREIFYRNFMKNALYASLNVTREVPTRQADPLFYPPDPDPCAATACLYQRFDLWICEKACCCFAWTRRSREDRVALEEKDRRQAQLLAEREVAVGFEGDSVPARVGLVEIA